MTHALSLDLLTVLGCRLPLIQAPMAGVQGSRLAIAVCQAGGLGSLPCAMLSLSQIEQEIATIRSQTDQPFNVNFFAHQTQVYTPAMQEKWFARLQPYYEKFGLTQADIATTGGRQPFDETTADLMCELKPPVISFHFGLPEPRLLEKVKQTGAKILASATTVAEAKWLEARGVDAIIAQGLEAGGHRSMFLSQDISTQSGTFSLLPNIIANVNVPVISAGGISDKQTAEAGFVLGASMVQVGTAFLLADEADTKDFHRQALQSTLAYHTMLTNVFSGGIARGIATQFMQELGGISADAPPFPHAGFVYNPIKAIAEANNDFDYSSMWAGQNARLAKVGSAKQIIDRILGEV